MNVLLVLTIAIAMQNAQIQWVATHVNATICTETKDIFRKKNEKSIFGAFKTFQQSKIFLTQHFQKIEQSKIFDCFFLKIERKQIAIRVELCRAILQSKIRFS